MFTRAYKSAVRSTIVPVLNFPKGRFLPSIAYMRGLKSQADADIFLEADS
jgi:hypothetical protein